MIVSPELLSACLRRDRVSQKELYVLLLPYLRAVCRRYLYRDSDLKDVLQESFVSIFKNIEQYDSEKGSFHKWATRITINRTLNNNRRNSTRKEEEFSIKLHDYSQDPIVFSNLNNEALLKILKNMPADFYQVFNLYCIDGYEHQEIADVLEISSALSRKRLSRARDWMKKAFKSDTGLIDIFPPSNSQK